MIDGGAHLLLRNLTPSAARLRFRFHGHEVWDTWLAACGEILVPDPRHADIRVVAHYVDPLTQVGYSLPSRLSHTSGKQLAPARFVAQMAMSEGRCSFKLEDEASSRPGEIQFLNLTNAVVEFVLHYLRTPFCFSLFLPSQAESDFHTGKIEMSATVNGYTTAAMPITQWDSEFAIEAQSRRSAYPDIRRISFSP